MSRRKHNPTKENVTKLHPVESETDEQKPEFSPIPDDIANGGEPEFGTTKETPEEQPSKFSRFKKAVKRYAPFAIGAGAALGAFILGKRSSSSGNYYMAQLQEQYDSDPVDETDEEISEPNEDEIEENNFEEGNDGQDSE